MMNQLVVEVEKEIKDIMLEAYDTDLEKNTFTPLRYYVSTCTRLCTWKL